MIHPKVKSVGLFGIVYAGLMAVLAGLHTLPSSQWTDFAVATLGALGGFAAGWLTPSTKTGAAAT